MTIGTIFGGLETLAGVITGNPAMVIHGVKRVATSLIVGAALEPVKDIVGEGVSNMIDTVN